MSRRFLSLAAVVVSCALPVTVAQAEPTSAPSEVLADVDPTNDFVVAPPEPIADCEDKLRAAGVAFTPAQLPVTPGRGKRPTCGVEQAVVYKSGPAKIRYNAPPLVSCRLALGLARFETVLSQQAQRYFGQEVSRIEQGGTYNCRKMARFDLVSEHAYANAIDIRSVTLKNGRKLSVLGGFGRIDEGPKRPEARFWRTLANRLFDEGAFSVVITPFYDSLHRDHIHLDEGRYRADGSRCDPSSAVCFVGNPS